MKGLLCTVAKAAGALALTIAFGFITPAEAGSLTLDTWEQFGFSTAGTPATGCDPDDPAGPFCIASSGTPTSFLDAPPWTFVSPGMASLTVTDAFAAGDRFEVFDFGVSIGLTSAPFGSADCGDDPVPCLATPGISSGVFILAAGNHSLTITPTLSPSDGGSGYLIVSSAVPEPSGWILLCIGLSALWFLHRRVRRTTGGRVAQ
ncbi:MAG TPA: PEP-CTERM sorting domain-containing protein [Bryobacteraceae bacterium]|jgi:PEP-CTERM motif-containing protein|nr:PEP-CTERM sorting domain-containing protein [Bryobacteraceae bacterium]